VAFPKRSAGSQVFSACGLASTVGFGAGEAGGMEWGAPVACAANWGPVGRWSDGASMLFLR